MSIPGSSKLSVALGHVGHSLALAAIGFGVFFGWALVSGIPVGVGLSYLDLPTQSPAVGLSAFFAWLAIPVGLTFRCRHWIARKANEDAPSTPVKLWGYDELAVAGMVIAQLLIGIPILIAVLLFGAVVIYGAYLLLSIVSLPVAILVSAVIIAVAILIAAFKE